MTRIHNQESNRPDPELAHFYEHGDIYDTLHALDNLRLVVARLKRQGRLSAGELRLTGESLGAVEAVLQRKIAGSEVPGNGAPYHPPAADA